jgi:hypothetical protein
VKITRVVYRQQAQPRPFESLTIELEAYVEDGESHAAAVVALGARVRRALAAQLELARLPESAWLAADDDPTVSAP